MITVFHKDNKVVSVFDFKNNILIHAENQRPIRALFNLAKKYPDRLISWCLKDLEEYINHEGFKKTFSHNNIMASFELSKDFFINKRIGYVDSTPFINVKKDVRYPTWLMSSCVGGIHAKVLLEFSPNTFETDNLAYAVNSIAKIGMPKGLFCYSSPLLLKYRTSKPQLDKSSNFTVYKFVKQHYRTRWVFIAFLNSFIYERKLHVLPLFKALFSGKKRASISHLNEERIDTKSNKFYKSIDVVIPTIARKAFLKNVLTDLSNQSLLPNRVIIVEQAQSPEIQSELDFLSKTDWPFELKHHFIRQKGACNARNIAFKDVISDTIFLADDDIRFEKDLLENSLEKMNHLHLDAVTLSCRRIGEEETIENIMQWHTFGSGCSIIKSTLISKVTFDMAFEHGFGEDGDFGMKLRYLGADIAYFPASRITHLKADSGGFRTSFSFPWDEDNLKPKPSPTIMLHSLRHRTLYQHLGYKTLLFIKFFKVKPDYQIYRYISNMLKRWDKSIYWAKHLEANSDIR